MDRRSFIKLASLTGLSVVAPTAFAGGLGTNRHTAFEPYDGPLLLSFQASGGWETRFHCAPSCPGYFIKKEQLIQARTRLDF